VCEISFIEIRHEDYPMPNIQDVAKLAGVAPITVSRVINNNGYVSEKTRQRVEAVIDELAYVPNALGPSLRSKRTMTLALVLSDITNPFWTTVARGVEDMANEHGYHVIIGNTDESPKKQNEYLTLMLQKQVDGFLLVPASSNVSSSEIFRRQDVSFVVLDRQIRGKDFDSVRSDSVCGAYELTKHLLELGHKNIAVITGRPDNSTANDRVTGFQRAMDEVKPGANQQVYWGEFNQDTGYRFTIEALRSSPKPTAIFATNNFIAIGVMRALRDKDLHIPDDISIVAFDDLPAAITIDPFFTVASQPAYEMGQKATELLIARLANDAPQEHQEIILPIEIILRRSSGKPPVAR
jgi:LacI family transcriptional regulator